MATIRDVARESGVSIATVSVVLSGANRTVSDRTRAKVLTVARELHYRPNRSARALSSGRTDLVALWISEIRRAYFATVAHHVEQGLLRAGYDYLRVGGGHERDAGEWHGSCDGILSLDLPDRVRAYAQERAQILRRGKGTVPPPIVSLGTQVCTDVDFVGVDLGHGARVATERLISKGCGRVVFVTPAVGVSHSPTRHHGYMQTMQAAGRVPEVLTIGPSANRADARRAVVALVEQSGCPDGFFCYSDEVALGTCRALSDLRLRVPDDAEGIGCDGVEEGEYLTPSLTTIRHPYETQVDRAVSLLCRRIQEPDAPLVQEWLLPELVVRESC